MAASYTEDYIPVGGTKVHLLRGGRGDPLLVHGAGGPPGWRLFHERLAEKYTVYAPSHPGFGTSDDADWMENMRDLAEFYLWFLDVAGLDRGVDVIGSSMGGWLAAEMAVMSPRAFGKIVLVGAAGLQPEEGEIFDIFFWPQDEMPQHTYYNIKQVPEYDILFGSPPTPEQRDSQRRNREMAARLVWKPFLFSRQLPYFLPRVANPTLVLWGRQDAIIPAICGEQYQRLLPNARLEVIDECGHSPHIEKPEEFLRIVQGFLQSKG